MNQGKLEVVKQEMARVNVDILGISVDVDFSLSSDANFEKGLNSGLESYYEI